MSTDALDLDRLADPPRILPKALAAYVRLNNIFFVGVMWLGLSSFGLVTAIRHYQLPGDWLLLWEKREAPGWLMAVHRHENQGRHNVKHVSYSYHYEFQIPEGQRLTGESVSDNELFTNVRKGNPHGQPNLTIEYHPRQLEANRIKGTRAASGGGFIFFGLILPGLGLVISLFGVWLGWRESRLLRLGIPTEGFVHSCRLPTKRSSGSASTDGGSISWSSSKTEPEQPVADFRDRIWQRHRADIASAQKMFQNRFARGCGFTAAIAFAICFGGVLGAMILAVPTLVGFLTLGAQNVNPVPYVVIMAALGLVIGTTIALRWMMKKERRRQSADAANERPAAFDQVECKLTFWLADGESVGETKRTLKLLGTEEDEVPRPLLYDPNKPSRALFVTEFTSPAEIDEDGNWQSSKPMPVVRLVLVNLALLAPVAAWWWG